jgi:hypothetical protein
MLIPIFKKYSKEQFEKEHSVNFSLAEWVQISFPTKQVKDLDKNLLWEHTEQKKVQYEVNRYDVSFYDVLEHEHISVYVYYDSQNEIMVAIDEVTQNIKHNEQYYTQDTPFWDMVTKPVLQK